MSHTGIRTQYIMVAKNMSIKISLWYAILTCVLLLHVQVWEGGAHDSRILNETRTNPELNFPHPIRNKYYIVDAGYAHKK